MGIYNRTKAYRMYCPNCGTILAGIVREDRIARNTCRRCGVRVVRLEDDCRHVKVDLYWPKDGYLVEMMDEENRFEMDFSY